MQGSTSNNSCPRCSNSNTPYSNYCNSCGLAIDGLCPTCGTSNPNSTHHCTNCGHNFAADPVQPASLTDGSPPINTAEKPGGFWVRTVALLIDGIVLSAVQTVVFAAFAAVGFAGSDLFEIPATGVPVDQVDFPFVSFFIAFTIIGTLSLLYAPVLVSIWSTTIGKRAFDLYILRPDGSHVGFWRIMWRQIAEGITAIPFYLTYLCAAFRQDKRALHDLIADTVVVVRP
jgi:uncharacterized RDD family membrane protein YckC